MLTRDEALAKAYETAQQSGWIERDEKPQPTREYCQDDVWYFEFDGFTADVDEKNVDLE